MNRQHAPVEMLSSRWRQLGTYIAVDASSLTEAAVRGNSTLMFG